jgi:hypothetical protein
MKKRLTLKDVNQKLENLLSSKAVAGKATKPQVESHKASVAHDIKNSYIQNLHMRSSMFTLWLLSWLLFFVNKLPFIKPIVTLLSLYYGRTTWWKLLVKIRKAFIIFNAAIGVYIVFKTTGFSYDNILAGFSGMGYQYIEIFMNFTKRLFNWFIELFDHKLVPNVPGNPSLPTNKPKFGWSSPTAAGHDLTNPITSNLKEYLSSQPSLRDKWSQPISWFDSPLNININTTPWYKDLTTWIWIGTIVSATAGIVGIGYLGYIYLSDPISAFFKSGAGPTTNVNPPSPDCSGGIELADRRGIAKSV